MMAGLRRVLIAPAAMLLGSCGSPKHAADAPLSSTVEARKSASASACLKQGSEVLDVRAHRAVGTEPFWAARTNGRCVSYSHPENPDGTRVWTRYTNEADADVWTGALDGQIFELRIRREPGCSDGMSDRQYPLAAEVMMHGELRRGCAEPI